MNTNKNLPDENFTPASCQTNVRRSDYDVVLEMGRKYGIVSSYELKFLDFFENNAIIKEGTRYSTVFNRLWKALYKAYQDDKCSRHKYGRGYLYDFTNHFA